MLVWSCHAFAQTSTNVPTNNPTGTDNTFVGITTSTGTLPTGNNNVFMGYNAGMSNFFDPAIPGSGGGNTLLGANAGAGNTTGSGNVFIGSKAGRVGTTSAFSTYVGTLAGENSTGIRNTFLGAGAGQGNTGSGNIHIGNSAGYASGNSGNNVIIGTEAGRVFGGSNSVMLGNSAGYGATLGTSCVFLGYQSGMSNAGNSNTFTGAQTGIATTGSLNCFYGLQSGYTNSSGGGNTFYGAYSGKANSSGIYNTMLGYKSGESNGTGTNNVFLGYNTGFTNTSGSKNTYLGNHAGYYNKGDFNVCIGNAAGANAPSTESNRLYISSTLNFTASPLIYGDFATKDLKFNVNQDSTSRVTIESAATGISGLKFPKLVGYTPPASPTATNVLTVNSTTGDVVLMNLALGGGGTDTSIYSHDGTLNTTTVPSATPNTRTVDMAGNNLFFRTSGAGSTFENGTVGTGRVYIGNAMLFPNLNTIGPNFSMYRLLVEGGILTEKVKVALRYDVNGGPGNDWADYVFSENYNLMPLREVESFIKANKHLPGIASAEELSKTGLDLGAMQAKQMEKIEELTLHLIEQNKIVEKQSKEIEELKAQVKLLLEKR